MSAASTKASGFAGAAGSGSGSYSPMSCLPPLPLTPSGLPSLDAADGEVELLSRDNVELRCDSADPMIPIGADGTKAERPPGRGRWIDRDEGLSCVLTTHRVVLTAKPSGGAKRHERPDARFVHLSSVAQAASAGGGKFSFSSPKIALSTYAYGELLLVFRGSKSTSSSVAAKDRDETCGSLQKALDRKAWEESARAKERQKGGSVNVLTKRKVGVDAILTKNKLKHKQAAILADEAFKDDDVETLMKEAGELVAVIRKYVATLEQQQEKSTSSGKDKEKEEQDAMKLTGMLEDMGMISALSKKQHSDKDSYYQTLARLLADFLRGRLQDAGGMMTLTDVYCLFNRARGTNMISPDDLVKALPWMKELGLGVSRRDFPSGVIVIQDDEFDDDKMANRLKDLASSGDGEKNKLFGGITALDVSRAFKMSAVLAYEQLLSAERTGHLCRDVTLEGTRFFVNRFMEDDFAVKGWGTTFTSLPMTKARVN